MNEQIFVPAEKPLSLLVSAYGNKVVLHMSEPREYLALTGTEPVVIGTQMLAKAIEADPGCGKDVLDLAMALMDHVYAVRGDLKPAGGAVKHELIERHRRTLSKRFEVMLNSIRERKTTSNRGLAKQLVDAALHEVFS